MTETYSHFIAAIDQLLSKMDETVKKEEENSPNITPSNLSKKILYTYFINPDSSTSKGWLENITDPNKKGKKYDFNLLGSSFKEYHNHPDVVIHWPLLEELQKTTYYDLFIENHNELQSVYEKLIKRSDKKYAFKEEIMNMFFRLTNYNSGSIVPFRDLTDSEVMAFIFDLDPTSKEIGRWKIVWRNVVEIIFLKFQSMNVVLPAPYHPNLGAFERKDELYEVLLELENSFSQFTPYKES